MSEVKAIKDWCPTVIYEPIPVREFTTLAVKCHAHESLLSSPNAEEALSLLSIDQPPSRSLIEQAADRFLEYGIGNTRGGWIIIRSGELGAYVKSPLTKGRWIDAFWTAGEAQRVVDVTGQSTGSYLQV
ncbi:hypothetical protein H0H93_000438 [Arthromyces matolae]|nr:hypothetical protein H0H93_000438 [Arthromyces matolae]